MTHADLSLRGRVRVVTMVLGLAAGALAASSAQAGGFFENYWHRHYSNFSRAWCSYTFGESSAVECSYDTYEQCRVSMSGVGGFCSPNPNYAAAAAPPPRPVAPPPHHRRHRVPPQ